MKVLLADALDPSAAAELRAQGYTVDVRPELGADDLASELADYDALVVRSTKVGAEAISSSRRLSLVVRAGAGTENIDVAAASAQGIHVCNIPGRNAVAVAELTFGLLLAIDRHIASATADLRAGVWNKTVYSDADGLMGRTMGVVGLGEIGLEVAQRAKAFGMTVLGLRKPGRSEATESRIRSIGIRLVDSLEELVASSDVVTLHVPGGDDTRSMVDAGLLAHFKDGAILLNTSRGDVVDDDALIEAMDAKGIRAGLDVYRDEPPSGGHSFESPLARHPLVVGTHHIGASTEQAQLAIARAVVESVCSFAAGEPIDCINLAPRDEECTSLIIRHHDRVGVLAAIFGVLRGGGLNIQHMENRVFQGHQAAVAAIDVSAGFTDDLKRQLEELPDVLGVGVAWGHS